MEDKKLCSLPNKIRTILLSKIDKEISISTKQNHLLINSQTQEQLTEKFINYRNFIVEEEESFGGVQNNEDNCVFCDLRCIYSDNRFNYFCYSSKISNGSLFPQNCIVKSFPQKKNNLNSQIKKIKILKITENNLHKLKINIKNKIIPETNSSSFCNENKVYNNSLPLTDDNTKKDIKNFSCDFNFNIDSSDNKNDDSSKLINYCYKLKKPNDEIINEISDDDTSTNKRSNKNLIFHHIIENNHKNNKNKKLKKIIKKKKIVNKINYNNDDEYSILSTEKSSINFTNETKIYFENIEIANSNDIIKNKYSRKKRSNVEPKKINNFKWTNIFELHNNDAKLNRNSVIKNKLLHFKSIDNDSLILKKTKKHKREEKQKNNGSFSLSVTSDKQYKKKRLNRSKTLSKVDGELQQNKKIRFGKKCLKNNGNKRKISLNIPYCNKVNHTNDTSDSIDNRQNSKINSSLIKV